MNFKIKILEEHGYNSALTGLSLSYNRPLHEMKKVADKIYANGSHGKFLESISVWLDISACRHWWVEADTYRIGITKQSESTMHTITKRELTQNDFVNPIFESTLAELNKNIRNYKEIKQKVFKKEEDKDRYLTEIFRTIKDNLPEGFLQRRVICTNYKTLRHIISQRKNHKLEEWLEFVRYIQENAKYKEWLV